MIEWYSGYCFKALTPPYVIDGVAWCLKHQFSRGEASQELPMHQYHIGWIRILMGIRNGDRRAVYAGTFLPRRTTDSCPITPFLWPIDKSECVHSELSKSMDLIQCMAQGISHNSWRLQAKFWISKGWIIFTQGLRTGKPKVADKLRRENAEMVAA